MNNALGDRQISKSIAAFLMVTILFITGCTSGSGPDDALVKKMIREEITARDAPGTWLGLMGGGQDTKMTSIEIVEQGKASGDQKVWPFRVRVIGTTMAKKNMLRGLELVSFDKIVEFEFYKDDYDKWKLSYKRF